MKTPLQLSLAATLACTLAACHVPDTTMENGAITLYGSTVTLRVAGAPKATITTDGVFTIDGEAVAITPAQRSLLTRYNQNVRAVHATGIAMGKSGVESAVKAVRDKISDKPANADKSAKAGAAELDKLSRDICTAEAGIKDAQDQLAAQLPAFKPYAGIIDAAEVKDCRDDASH